MDSRNAKRKREGKKPTRYDKPTQDLLFPIQVHRLVIGI